MRASLHFPILPLILAALSALSCATGTEGPVCGNGLIERGEECDRDDIAQKTCTDLGFGRGVVTCGSFCTFSTVACFPACASECDTEGQGRCQGNQLETCALSEDGCLRWALSRDCAADGLVCNDFLTPPACSDSCQDTCTQDDSRCYGFTVQSCDTGVSGCTQWTDQTQCSDSSQVCSEAGGTAVCTTECEDPCASEGLRRCTDQTAQVCVADAIGCRVFLDIQDCAATSQFCVDGFCSDCPAAPCASGARRCSGTTVERCTTDANGCLNWTSYIVCVELCFNGVCTRVDDPRE